MRFPYGTRFGFVYFSRQKLFILMKPLLSFCLIVLTTLSCTTQEHILPADTCKLARIVNGVSTSDFTYDASGNLSKWLITSVFPDGKTQLVNYDFTRDATGRISSLNQTITFDGKIEGTATALFTYTNGLLTSTSTTTDPAQPGSISRTFTNDSNGRMSKRVVIDKISGFTSTETYEYDSQGNCTNYNYTDPHGIKNEIIATYDTSKNPEQLLIKSIPFNLLTGLPWSVNTTLTTKETFVGSMGTTTYIGKQTDLKTDAKGYVTSMTLTYDDGYVSKRMYSLINCQ